MTGFSEKDIYMLRHPFMGLLLGLMLVGYSSAQGTPSTIAYYSSTFTEKFGEWVESDATLASVEFFDAGGLLIEEVRYDSSGSISGRMTYEVADGRHTRSQDFSASDILTYETTYVYTDAGLLSLEEQVTVSTGDRSLNRYAHDASGRVVLMEQIGGTGRVLATQTYQYDGQVLVETRWEDGFLVNISRYNPQTGLLSTVGLYTLAGDEMAVTRYEYTFNDQGDWIERFSQANVTPLGVQRNPHAYSEYGFQRPRLLYRDIKYH